MACAMQERRVNRKAAPALPGSPAFNPPRAGDVNPQIRLAMSMPSFQMIRTEKTALFHRAAVGFLLCYVWGGG